MKSSIQFCFFLVSLFQLFISCNETPTSKKSIDEENNNEAFIIKKIFGKWGGLGEESPVFDIRKDSIYYFQHLKSYSYQISGNNMVVNFGNHESIFKDIQVKKDTLLFTDDAGILVRGYRFK